MSGQSHQIVNPAGVALALLSAALFGASTPIAKLLLGTIDPWLLAGILYLASGIGLGAVIMLQRLRGVTRTEARLTGSDLPWLAGAVLAGGVVGPVLLMFGLASTQASTAALLLNLEGLATMVIAWTVFRENVDRRLLIGAAAILAGALLVSWRGGPAGVGPGALAIAGACLAWGVDNNLTRKLSAADPVQIAAIKGLVAGPINLVLAFWQGAAAPGAALLAGAAVVGFVGYGISLALFVLALRHLGAARTGAYFSIAPFVGAVLGVAILHDPVTLQLAAAAILMGIGVWLHITEAHEHEHLHEVMAHDHAHVHDEHHRHPHGQNDPAGEPHSHWHGHARMVHRHPHYPDLHHRHSH
ncbi:DMT family transporter [Methylocella tundrae]|uniref:EamA family transporter n=1 Tax=Methylocella tundrae TaxID=227605 RepID=A0A4U8Z6J6_METTU|nr:DMT family transporter [Methylocella tundrae]WPP03050.1 EamA family transporter [Methylocella tundrae]VFU16287.1 EamA family transporter [Methylocella tundrae]